MQFILYSLTFAWTYLNHQFSSSGQSFLKRLSGFQNFQAAIGKVIVDVTLIARRCTRRTGIPSLFYWSCVFYNFFNPSLYLRALNLSRVLFMFCLKSKFKNMIKTRVLTFFANLEYLFPLFCQVSKFSKRTENNIELNKANGSPVISFI